MAYELVKAVSVHCRHLPGTQYKVLMRMAIRALDFPNGDGRRPRLYYGGWDELAIAIGAEPGTATTHQRVARPIRELIAAGWITRMTNAHPGTRQVYRINLDIGGSQRVD